MPCPVSRIPETRRKLFTDCAKAALRGYPGGLVFLRGKEDEKRPAPSVLTAQVPFARGIQVQKKSMAAMSSTAPAIKTPAMRSAAFSAAKI